MLRSLLVAALAVLTFSCGGGVTGGPTPAGHVSCTITATTTYSPTPNQVVTGQGDVACDGPADLSVNVCLYAQGAGATTWGTALICQTKSVSTATSLTQATQVGVGPTATKSYRTVVTWTLNGTAQTDQASSPVSAP